jgi:Protein of unknown function (DUF3179)
VTPAPNVQSNHLAARCLALVLTVMGAIASPEGVALTAAPAQASAASPMPTAVKPQPALVPITTFLAMLEPSTKLSEASLAKVIAQWRDGYAPMLLEMMGLMASSYTESLALEHLMLVSKVQVRDSNALYRWVWGQNFAPHPDYAEFKARLYEVIDPQFREYFENRPQTSIRLDEIRWGGVRRDGIPPLKNPKMLSAAEATYLGDQDIVFGVAIDGDVRAYPKRILAWHEMFKDRIAGRELNGVYCTLCGAMILYDTTVRGVQHELGTSGFLYRSNKLMYDHATKSMWSTLNGAPVVGPLVGKGIVLPSLFVVTSTWGEWKKRHPGTRVLSLDTGHERDYAEGAAYRSYFATDNLMFGVPKIDKRLPNKAEILALRFNEAPAQQLAIAADFLARNPVYHDRLGKQALVVMTDASGANRVYETKGKRFTAYDQGSLAKDQDGGVWKLEEARLAGPGGASLNRLSAHRAFWFGWHSAYPATRLVK